MPTTVKPIQICALEIRFAFCLRMIIILASVNRVTSMSVALVKVRNLQLSICLALSFSSFEVHSVVVVVVVGLVISGQAVNPCLDPKVKQYCASFNKRCRPKPYGHFYECYCAIPYYLVSDGVQGDVCVTPGKFGNGRGCRWTQYNGVSSLTFCFLRYRKIPRLQFFRWFNWLFWRGWIWNAEEPRGQTLQKCDRDVIIRSLV